MREGKGTKRATRAPKMEQLTFDRCMRGGARPGAGRPKKADSGVSHLRRPKLSRNYPVHVTMKLRGGLPSMRRKKTLRALLRAMEAGKERFGFRLNHYSIQSNHLHMIVEAKDRRAMARGMKGLNVRIARALNRLWRRRGTLFADRYHEVILRTPRHVRNVLGYVLKNALRHHIFGPFPDPYSSGGWFDGWRELKGKVLRGARGPTSGIAPARTWLLREGWRKRGLIPIDTMPGPS